MSSDEESTIVKLINNYKAINNEQLLTKMNNVDTHILDIRETEEYLEGHIPGSISMPLSNLENDIEKLDMKKQYYIICRTGRRVEIAIEKFANHGFEKIVKVIPGMIDWNGDIDKGK